MLVTALGGQGGQAVVALFRAVPNALSHVATWYRHRNSEAQMKLVEAFIPFEGHKEYYRGFVAHAVDTWNETLPPRTDPRYRLHRNVRWARLALATCLDAEKPAVHTRLATLHEHLGDQIEARREYQRALAISESTTGRDLVLTAR